MAKQMSLLPEADSATAKVADRVVELFKERASVKEKLEAQSRNLAGLLKKLGLQGIRHAGYIIKVDHKPESTKLNVKEDKGAASGQKKAKPK